MENNNENLIPKDQVVVILEEIRSQNKLFGEKLDGVSERMDRGFLEANKRMDKIELSLDVFKIDTKDNFKVVLEYLSRLDDEIIEIKVGLEKFEKGQLIDEDVSLWKKKILQNEKEISKLQAIVAALTKTSSVKTVRSDT